MWIEAINDAALSDDMPGLNEQDLKRIDAKINAASVVLQGQITNIGASIHQTITSEIALLKPKGWRRAVHVLREIGPLTAIIGIVLTLITITLGALYQSFSHVNEEAEFRANTKNQLDGFGVQLIGLRALISANQPQRPQNQTAAKLVLAEARQKSIEIPLDVLEQAGGRFIEAAAEETPNMPPSHVWDIALDYVSYRSSLNSGDRPVVKFVPLPAATIWHYTIGIRDTKTGKPEMTIPQSGSHQP